MGQGISSRGIRFLLGNELVEIPSTDPTLTVLDYLRLHRHRTGTKEGCAEGDCGACTIVLGELDATGKHVAYKAVNSCIQFIGSLDGKQVLTVEDLKGPNDALHPVQQALVESHGSQCGFCTPGFVMSLFALFHEGGDRAKAPDRSRIDEALAGNLCRCTGYGPIIAAARRMHEIAPRDGFDLTEAGIAERLAAIRPQGTTELSGAAGRCFVPRSADALARLYLEYPGATLVAGGTDVGLWVTKRHRKLDPVIHVGEVLELRRIAESPSELVIGAAVTYTELLERFDELWPDFGALIRRLGAAQVRNAATMGGNIANGSPIGDGPPALIALNAALVLRRGDARREMPLEDFFIAHGKQDRLAGEFVEAIRLKKPRPGQVFRCYKIAKRFDQDISALMGAFHLRIGDGGVADIRICFGGMAAVPRRARAVEAALMNKPWTEATIAAAMPQFDSDFQPISDLRASREYRRRVAGNLLQKFFIETSNPDVMTRLTSLDRWAHG